ncbi:hypothetical protein C8R43DRAFT_984622 [Mycena crocata]|nr:hypothetical protein C8R43DRAFT_984622 [Mycena crocata]
MPFMSVLVIFSDHAKADRETKTRRGNVDSQSCSYISDILATHQSKVTAEISCSSRFKVHTRTFFMAHIDIASLQPGFESPLPFFDPGLPDMAFSIALLWNITQPLQASIAVIEGRTRGVGNQFLMSCDMRFASTSPSVLLGLETSLGANPGAGGEMHEFILVGRVMKPAN